MRNLFVLVAVLGIVGSAGCHPKPKLDGEPFVLENTPAVLRMTETPSPAITTPGRLEVPVNKPSEFVPPTATNHPATGEVPVGLLEAIFEDAVRRTGAASEEISVIQAQAVVWGDGSLGCPQPGMAYTQSIVNGYWIVLEVDGKQSDYRATTSGYFILCAAGIHPISPGNSPDS